MHSASIEDYIKTIYALEAEEHKATTKRIAQRLSVKMASVTGMVKHLAAEGYVRHKLYHGAHLTDQGRLVALNMIRRHRVIELFLSKTLGLRWDEVDADADVLEHAVSDKLVERIFQYLGCPEFDPHGAPIPGRDGSIAPQRGLRLDQLATGDRGRVVEVADGDPEFLRYLTKLKIKIGSRLRVRERAPFGGPVSLELDSRTVAIGPEACSRIRVHVDKHPKPSRTAKRHCR
jgi:DtxR family Mn-dependent transcriptional regulator